MGIFGDPGYCPLGEKEADLLFFGQIGYTGGYFLQYMIYIGKNSWM